MAMTSTKIIRDFIDANIKEFVVRNKPGNNKPSRVNTSGN